MNFSSAKRLMVLVVEDDFLIRMHAAEMITDAGFDVVEAANADAAILILEDRLDVTVVFTDIQMPGSMDGFEIGGGYQGTQATDQDRRHVRSRVFGRTSFPRADVSCRSHTARIKLSERFAS
jgi:CheY-like chemotaxis protein